jgi:hypothetical protein
MLLIEALACLKKGRGLEMVVSAPAYTVGPRFEYWPGGALGDSRRETAMSTAERSSEVPVLRSQ